MSRAAELEARIGGGPPLILDGPMGTEIDRRGGNTGLPLWSAWALIDAPHRVQEVHEDYRRVGAEILTTNTFRTHGRSLRKAGHGARAAELTALAVRLARQALRAAEGPGWVAGSMAPLEDCYSPDLTPGDAELESEHRQMADRLAAAGVDLFLVETMPTVREAVAATRGAAHHGVPVFTGFTCRPDGALVSGESIADAASAVASAGATGVMVNCSAAATLHVALGLLEAATDLPLAAYGNVGHAEDTRGWAATDVLSAGEYAALARRWLDLGARVVGGCCGTSPDHIAALRDLVDGLDQSGETQ